MKKLIFILFVFASSCSNFQNNQKEAEQTVKDYILSKDPKANIKNVQFIKLDLNGNVIGVVVNKTIYSTDNRPLLIRTIYYKLDKDLAKVTCIFTN